MAFWDTKIMYLSTTQKPPVSSMIIVMGRMGWAHIGHSQLGLGCRTNCATFSLHRKSEDVKRIEYEPSTSGPRRGEGTMFLNRRMKLGECMAYVRTWSSFSAWRDEFQKEKRDDSGEGDIVDDVFDEMRSVEPKWKSEEAWKEREVEFEWEADCC